MHEIEPFYRWRDLYIASEDARSPFFGRIYNEFDYTHQLYNFYLHPQWDDIGSSTLYVKVLYADYVEGTACIELIGEWNDTLHNDIMYLRYNLLDQMMAEGISRFVLFCENVLNFHAAEDDYYFELSEELRETGGWVALVNLRLHVEEEFLSARLDQFLRFGEDYNDINWRTQKPDIVCHLITALVDGRIQRLAD